MVDKSLLNFSKQFLTFLPYSVISGKLDDKDEDMVDEGIEQQREKPHEMNLVVDKLRKLDKGMEDKSYKF